MTKCKSILIGLIFFGTVSASGEAIGPLSIRGSVRSISPKLVELQTEGETLLVPKEYFPKDKLQSKSQIVLQLTDEQILEVQVK